MNCPNCGATIEAAQAKCFKCGGTLQTMQTVQNIQQTSPAQPPYQGAAPVNPEEKDWTTALLLCFFLGFFGAHRFYTGSIGIGLVQFFTGAFCGIWWLIDFILIITGAYRDSRGNKLSGRK
jgi:hypothetical protein